VTALSKKLQLRPETRVAVVAPPESVELGLAASEIADDPEAADGVIVFVHRAAELETLAAPAIQAAQGDRLAWIAYPKAGALGTDLSRDGLAEAVRSHGIQPVRQVAVDETWSALRFRPA
jgi:hypothetical protein